MKRLTSILAILIAVFFVSSISAQSQGQNRKQTKSGVTNVQNQVNWVDADGDGICDNVGTANQGSGKGYGIKDGTHSGTKPQDGTGYGKKGSSSKNSGNGQKGSQSGKGRN